MAESFLISRLSSLGDVVCTLPAACALKGAFPESHITWIVDPRFRSIVDACSAVDQVIAEKTKLAASPSISADREFDAAFDMQGLLKSAWPVARCRAKKKLGYHWQREASWLFTRTVLPDPSSVHIVDQYVDVVRGFIGADSSKTVFRLNANSEALQSVQAKLAENQVEKRFVVINAGAAWASKRWPASSFGAVIDMLAAQGVQCVLIGSKAAADIESAEAVKSASKTNPVDLLGQTSIAELIALISLSSAHLGGDTGSTHIAAALGKPAIGLYSITRPERSCPYGQRHRTHYDPNSLSNISAESVFETVVEAIAER